MKICGINYCNIDVRCDSFDTLLVLFLWRLSQMSVICLSFLIGKRRGIFERERDWLNFGEGILLDISHRSYALRKTAVGTNS